MVQNGLKVACDAKGCKVINNGGDIIITGYLVEGMFCMSYSSNKTIVSQRKIEEGIF